MSCYLKLRIDKALFPSYVKIYTAYFHINWLFAISQCKLVSDLPDVNASHDTKTTLPRLIIKHSRHVRNGSSNALSSKIYH